MQMIVASHEQNSLEIGGVSQLHTAVHIRLINADFLACIGGCYAQV